MNKEAADRMTMIIESCWDENNPDDGLTFDERLKKKLENLPSGDKELMEEVLKW